MRREFVKIGIVIFLYAFFQGCEDKGTEVSGLLPFISSVTPDTVSIGDTLSVVGSSFGNAQGNSTLSLGGCTTATIVRWTNTEVKVKVPNVASTVVVIMVVTGNTSNGKSFGIRNYAAGAVSYACDVRPIQFFGCAISGCHVPPTPTGGFDQTTYATLIRGGVTYGSNVIIAGDSTRSEIMRALRGTATVGRMPFGGPWFSTGVPDPFIRKIGTWIAQGAKEN